MRDVTIEEDWDRESPLMYHRQHHPLGQQELAIQIGLHMHMPPQDGSLKAYQDYLYLSQVSHLRLMLVYLSQVKLNHLKYWSINYYYYYSLYDRFTKLLPSRLRRRSTGDG